MTTTERTQEQVESEAQWQNPAPIGEQPPFPDGVHDMIVSWDRKEGYMSVRVDGGRWWFKEMLGEAVLTGNENSVGRILITAKGELHGEQLQLWRSSQARLHPMVYGDRRVITLNRMCYFRAEAQAGRPCWRLRDNRITDWSIPGALVMLESYIGDWDIEWRVDDTIAHLFHTGFVMVCQAGCFLHPKGGHGHLYGRDRWVESEAYAA